MKKKSGFTIVEVSLFLAITAAVFVGIAIGTQNSIFQQRYNDSVQNFAEFLRSVYSQVTNVQSEGSGRTGYAIYGKLVVFGSDNGMNKIKSFNVIGLVNSNETDENEKGISVLGQLRNRDANVIYRNSSENYTTVGLVEDYTPKWSAQIQTTKEWDNGGYNIFEGALLIVRSPDTGSVNTYVMAKSGVGTNMLAEIENGHNPFMDYVGVYGSYLTDPYDGFKKDQVDFCINPNGANKSNLRRNVRIMAGARNSSGIVVVPDDESECK